MCFQYENKYPCFSFANVIDVNSLTPFVPIGNSSNHFGLFSIRYIFAYKFHKYFWTLCWFQFSHQNIAISTIEFWYMCVCVHVHKKMMLSYDVRYEQANALLQFLLSKQILNWLNWAKNSELRVARFVIITCMYSWM